jgi:hypothetical protein
MRQGNRKPKANISLEWRSRRGIKDAVLLSLSLSLSISLHPNSRKCGEETGCDVIEPRTRLLFTLGSG